MSLRSKYTIRIGGCLRISTIHPGLLGEIYGSEYVLLPITLIPIIHHTQVQCSTKGDPEDVCQDKKDELVDKCPSGKKPSPDRSPTMEAFSNPTGRYSTITFCNKFFDMNSLSWVIKTAKKNNAAYQNDLRNYDNRARVLFHEMTHLDWFMNTPKKSPFVDDVRGNCVSVFLFQHFFDAVPAGLQLNTYMRTNKSTATSVAKRSLKPFSLS